MPLTLGCRRASVYSTAMGSAERRLSTEWSSSDDAGLWDASAGDGLG